MGDKVTKVAIFSDIHSNFLVFNKALEDAKKNDIDLYLFLGDYIADGFDDNLILDAIKSKNMYAINGNREYSVINYDKVKNNELKEFEQYRSLIYCCEHLNKENLEFIKTLDMYKIIDIEGKKICMSHSRPDALESCIIHNSYKEFDKLIENYPADIYIFGHQHKWFCTKYKEKHFLNPGSIGLPRNGLPYNYGILEIDEDIKFIKKEVHYEYAKLEKYYRNSDYYKFATIWCELLLKVMKEGHNYPFYFVTKIREMAKLENIDISKHIPNELFRRCYYEYIEDAKIKDIYKFDYLME